MWVLVSSTGKVSDKWIRDMRFNHHQDQKLKTRILIESSNGIKSSACVKTIQKHQIDKYGFVFCFCFFFFVFFENHMVLFFPYASMSFYYELTFSNDPQKKKKKKKLTNLFKWD